MDIHLSLRHGPLEVEIDADSEDDYQAELLELLEFLEEYEKRFNDLEMESVESIAEENEGPVDDQASINAYTDTEKNNQPDSDRGEESDLEADGEDPAVASLAKKVDASTAELREFVDIDPGGEELPWIVPETDEFADTKTHRQFIGSLVLLAVWDDCYEEDRVRSSTLKDALELSGISSSSMYNMYDLDDAQSSFDKSGKGRSATIGLTRPGKRDAYKQIRKLLD